MVFGATRTLAGLFCVSLLAARIAHADCPINTVILKGRVEHASRDARVRVQLLYSKDLPGESGETSVENGTFSIPIEFLTLSKRPLLRNLPEKCNRKPRTVNITLIDADQEFDPVALDFAKDFKMADLSAYTLRSDLVLNGKR
jgi:hypothetical protein